MMTLLLLASRRAIMNNTPTALSRALSFLVRYVAPRVLVRTAAGNHSRPPCKPAPHMFLTLCVAAACWWSSDYKPTFMWWELLMLWRQLFLVGFAILIKPGTVEQAVISFLVAILFLLLHAVAVPFKADGDNYIGQACIDPRSRYIYTFPPSSTCSLATNTCAGE